MTEILLKKLFETEIDSLQCNKNWIFKSEIGQT